jgi:preprotein translocase subunit SecE
MSTEDKLDSRSKRRRWRKEQAEEALVEAEVAEDDGDEEDEADSRGLTAKKDRATPSRRQREEAEEVQSGNIVTRPVIRLVEYLRDVRSELGKVTWPTREEALQLTRIVLLTTIVSSLILGLITLLFTELFKVGLQAPLIFAGLFVMVVASVIWYLRRGTPRATTY